MREISGERAQQSMLDILREKGEAQYAALAMPVVPGQGIYLVRRQKKPHAGLYSLTGGKVEYVEDRVKLDPGSVVGRLQHNGLENMNERCVKEVLEELFHGKNFRWVERELVDSGDLKEVSERLDLETIFDARNSRMREYTKPELLRKFSWRRPHDFIFDARTGYYCAIYKVRVPVDALPFRTSKREIIDEPVPLDEITDIEEVNPITRFVLYQASANEGMRDLIPNRFAAEPTNITAGVLESIVVPEDFEKTKHMDSALQPSKKTRNSFYITYSQDI